MSEEIEGLYIRDPCDEYFSADNVRARSQNSWFERYVDSRAEHHFSGFYTSYNFLGPNTEFEARMIGSDFYEMIMTRAGLQLVGTKPYDKPINAIDACAMRHDAVFSKLDVNIAEAEEADKKFIECVWASNLEGPEDWFVKYLAWSIISTKRIAESVGILPRGSFSRADNAEGLTGEDLPQPTTQQYRNFFMEVMRVYVNNKQSDFIQLLKRIRNDEFGGYATPIRLYAKSANPMGSAKQTIEFVIRELVKNKYGNVPQQLIEKVGKTTQPSRVTEKKDFTPLDPFNENVTPAMFRATKRIKEILKVPKTSSKRTLPLLDEPPMEASSPQINPNTEQVESNKFYIILAFFFRTFGVLEKMLENMGLIGVSAAGMTIRDLTIDVIFNAGANYARGDLSRFFPESYRPLVRYIAGSFVSRALIKSISQRTLKSGLTALLGLSDFRDLYRLKQRNLDIVGKIVAKSFVSIISKFVDAMPSVFDAVKSKSFSYNNFLQDTDINRIEDEIADFLEKISEDYAEEEVLSGDVDFNPDTLGFIKDTTQFNIATLQYLKLASIADNNREKLINFIRFFVSLQNITVIRTTASPYLVSAFKETLRDNDDVWGVIDDLKYLSWNEAKDFFRTKMIRTPEGVQSLYDYVRNFNDNGARGLRVITDKIGISTNPFRATGDQGFPFKDLVEYLFSN